MPFGEPMKASEKAYNLIRNFEGCRLMPYLCPAGVWTVGWGSTTDVTPGELITMAQAEDRLKNDASAAEQCVNDAVNVPLNQNEFDALVSFVFNLGCGNFRKSTLLKMLNDSDYEGAGMEFRRWDKGGGKVLPGLVRRRLAEQRLFETEN